MVLRLKAWESRSPPGRSGTRDNNTKPTQIAPSSHKTTSTQHATHTSTLAGWSSPVARQAHNLKAAGSNPAPATKSQKPLILNMDQRLFAVRTLTDETTPWKPRGSDRRKASGWIRRIGGGNSVVVPSAIAIASCQGLTSVWETPTERTRRPERCVTGQTLAQPPLIAWRTSTDWNRAVKGAAAGHLPQGLVTQVAFAHG
jgi:hypothetical protein